MNISKDEKKVLSFWIVLTLIILIVVFVFYESNEHVNRIDREAKEQLVYYNTNYISNRDLYYTVKNAVNRYYFYINMKDYDSILNIINKQYVTNNGINKNNITKFVNVYDKNIYFDTKKLMCLKKVSNSVINLVLKGREFTNDNSIDKEVYYEITLDYNTGLYDLKSINNKYYEEVCNGKN